MAQGLRVLAVCERIPGKKLRSRGRLAGNRLWNAAGPEANYLISG